MANCPFCGSSRGEVGRLRVCCEEGAKADHYPTTSTPTLPAEAVEAAARAMHQADWPSMDWDRMAETTRNNYRRMALAAYPAIREAVVAEIVPRLREEVASPKYHGMLIEHAYYAALATLPRTPADEGDRDE